MKIVLADNQTNLCQDLLTIENTHSDLKVHALHYANELLVRIRLAVPKLLQTRQTSRNYQKQVLVMIKYCLGNSQINLIPAWSKYLLLSEFEGRTVSYGPSFFLLDLWPKREALNRREKKGSVTYSTNRENEVSKIFIISLLCVWGAQERFLFTRNGTSKAKRFNLKSFLSR